MAASEGATAAARVLVVDDNPDIRDLLQDLVGAAGYAVATAANGEEALEAAAQHRPDLVLLDVAMPGMDGYTVCRRLLAEAANGPEPAVIFLTARAETTARVAGLDAGAVDYIVKPFEVDELEARLRSALRMKRERDVFRLRAATDPLTGLANRGQLDQRAAEAVSLARRHGRPLAALLVDIDHFKEINDTHGHAAGDVVLKEVARRLQAFVRVSDTVARYGGEEFALLLPETDPAGALVLAERLREEVAATPVLLPPAAAEAVRVRVSVGVAVWEPALPNGAALLDAADRAMYKAKERGRDRVELAHDVPAHPDLTPADTSVASVRGAPEPSLAPVAAVEHAAVEHAAVEPQ